MVVKMKMKVKVKKTTKSKKRKKKENKSCGEIHETRPFAVYSLNLRFFPFLLLS